ncbi:hypothetical protein D3C76_1376790 [compost metagenome]
MSGDQRIFTPVMRIGNDRIGGHFRSGAAGGGNGDEFDVMIGKILFQRHFDPFRRIQRGTAAESNNHVRFKGFKTCRSREQNINIGIGFDLAKNRD